MNRVCWLVLVLWLGLPASAIAGPLYGTVRQGQAPAAGVEITVACPGFDRPSQVVAPVLTDARGSFSMRVPATGRCEMRVRRDDRVGTPFEVFVSNNALRFDFQIDGAMNRVR
jgi:hypothetical protein